MMLVVEGLRALREAHHHEREGIGRDLGPDDGSAGRGSGGRGRHARRTQRSDYIAYSPVDGDALDESASNQRGTVHGANLQSGKFGDSFCLDGDDYIQVPDDNRLAAPTK